MHCSMKKRKQYEKVVVFFYDEEGLFFYVASIKEDKVNFNKVAVLPDVAKILKKNNVDFEV